MKTLRVKDRCGMIVFKILLHPDYLYVLPIWNAFRRGYTVEVVEGKSSFIDPDFDTAAVHKVMGG